MRIVLPNTHCRILPGHGPYFYLAGPVRGGGDWQKKCCEEIQKIIPHFYVAIPYSHHSKESFPLMNQGMQDTPNIFPSQLAWKRHYMKHAAKHGCLIFWLPEENKENPRLPEEGSYATNTRGEIARWSVELKYNPSHNIVVGAEPLFPSLSQIQRDFSLDQGQESTFHTSLEAMVRVAIDKASVKIAG